MRKLIIFCAALYWFGQKQTCFNSGPISNDSKNNSIDSTLTHTSNITPIVLLTDATDSDPFIRPDTATLADFIRQFIYNGVDLTAIAVQSDSYGNEPFYSGMIRLDTLPFSGNLILNQMRLLENQRRKIKADSLLKSTLTGLQSRILNLKKCKRSDVQNALRLANVSASNPAYCQSNVWVIIASDLLQDMIPGKPEGLAPVLFPSNVKLVLIGHHPDVDIARLFPGKTPIEFISFKHLATLQIH